jgi:TIR domain
MTDIFISHAVADQPLAKLLVDFLKEAIGVPTTAIFCSSAKGHHIPLGEDFNAYIKQEIQTPKLFILLMTPAYMESSFCLMELGAAWAQSARNLAIVVPPTDFNAVTKTLGLKQAWKITEKPGLVDLRQLIRDTIPNLEKRSEHTWDEKRAIWNVALKNALAMLQPALKVDASDHQKALSELKEKDAEIERLETALGSALERYAELERAKDKDEVKAIKKRNAGSQALQDEFDELIAAVRKAKPQISNVVVKHIILDHFDLAGRIDWYTDRQEFEAAVKYGFISPDGGQVRWDRDKLKPLRKALGDVQAFLDGEDGQKLRELQDPHVPMDPDDLAFWEYHLRI